MARFAVPDVGRDKIDAVVERWKRECLLRDGSLLFGDRQLWTAAHIADFHHRFVEHTLEGAETFVEKIRIQLDDADDDLRWFVVELISVYLLFARKLIGQAGKLKLVEDVMGPLAAHPRPPHWPELAAAFGQGIGNPGTGYNTGRYLQVTYLLDFCTRWKQLPQDEQVRLLGQPWELRDFADDTDEAVREMRHVLLHLLCPEEFERISSGTHKQLIAAAFAPDIDEAGEALPDDLDERLLAIRRALADQNVQPDSDILDFYSPPLVERWNPKFTKPKAPAKEKAQPSAWVFQASPERFNLDGALAALPRIWWVTRQHKDKIRASDQVFLWESGPNGGLAAVGRVGADPQTTSTPADQREYWIDLEGFDQAEPRVPVEIEQVLGRRISRAELLTDPALKDLNVLRARSGTNFAVTPEQRMALLALIAGEDGETPTAPDRCFILNQLETKPGERAGAKEYEDREGDTYHWSSRSSGARVQLARSAGARFVYYRPRQASDGTAQSYFGAGRIGRIEEGEAGENGDRHWRASLTAYRRFDHYVPLSDGPATNLQHSIKEIAQADYERLLRLGFGGEGRSLSVEAVRLEAMARGLRLSLATYHQVVAALNSGKHVILTGPPGTAKTTLAQVVGDAAEELGVCAAATLLTTATADWTTYETIGGLRPRRQTARVRGRSLRGRRSGPISGS